MQSSARLKQVIATRFSLLVLLLALVWGFNLQSPSTALASAKLYHLDAKIVRFQPSITFHRARVFTQAELERIIAEVSTFNHLPPRSRPVPPPSP
jgi:hypothetical protein